LEIAPGGLSHILRQPLPQYQLAVPLIPILIQALGEESRSDSRIAKRQQAAMSALGPYPFSM
jgi:hypothetical protein